MERQYDEILAAIGAAVLFTQVTERTIAAALTLAFPEERAVTVESLVREIEANAKPTLGQLVLKLKRRINIDEDFESFLETFLRRRNALIHNTDRINGFDLNTPEGRSIASGFIDRLLSQAEIITKVFISALVSWASEAGFDQASNPEILQFLGEDFGLDTVLLFPKPAKID